MDWIVDSFSRSPVKWEVKFVYDWMCRIAYGYEKSDFFNRVLVLNKSSGDLAHSLYNAKFPYYIVFAYSTLMTT